MSAARTSFIGAARFPGGISLLLALIAGIVALLDLAPRLEFERAAFEAGAWWRLVTGHWTHFGWSHLLWDVSVFALLGLACEALDRRATAVTIAASTLVISFSIWLGHPEIHAYRGLSGIDSALFVLLCVLALRWLRRNRALLAPRVSRALASLFMLALVAFAAKTVAEQFTGATLFVDHCAAGFIPLALAHLAGGATGLVVGAFSADR